MRLNGNKKIAALIAAYSSNVSTFEAAKARERNKASGTIGFFTRRSSTMNATKEMADAAKAAYCIGPMPLPLTGDSMTAKVNAARAIVISKVPLQSIGRGSGAASNAGADRVCQTIISVMA